MPRIVFAALATIGIAFAQEKPDFSGAWKMDPERSESAHQAVPIGPVQLFIRQTATDVRIETQRREASKTVAVTEILSYKLDGSETTNSGSSGTPVKVKAHWDGAKLVTETARSIQDSLITTMQVLSLSPAGREMTIEKTLTVQHGYQFEGAQPSGKGKDVFVRVKARAGM